MKLLLHYLDCFFNLIVKYIVLVIRIVKNAFIKIFRVIRCILILQNSKNSSRDAVLSLEEIYADKGKTSKIRGFEYEVCTIDLSIIVPMYNVEKYIGDCIESIINQKTRYTYELILIDDGSTDDTSKVIEKYLSIPRIKLIKQENGGQSSARNNGICQSAGKHIMFVDADDILLPNAIEKLMSIAITSGSDVVEGNIVRFYNVISEEMISESKGKNHFESNVKNSKFVLTTYGYSWAKIYKRNLWNSLRFPEGYIFEDIITKFILRRKANQVVFIEDVVYGYRQNNQSSSHGNNQLKKLDSIWVLPKVWQLCQQEHVPRDDIFYLLSLNHIGLLNYVTTRNHSIDIRLACFAEMRKQLLSIQDCRPKKIPLMFRLLERSILGDKFDAWKYISETISKYQMLKKWKEIN